MLSLPLNEAFEAVIVHRIIDVRLLPPEFYEAITKDLIENGNDEIFDSETDINSDDDSTDDAYISN